jgi:predicted N-formylglutamate amidohydrolase
MKKLMLTCEHGGNKVPSAYKRLFWGKSAVLRTHRGLDIGALGVAKDLKGLLKAPLNFSEVSRLLVDLNRFLESPTLFSEFTKGLKESERQKILKLYYHPHWKKVSRHLQSLVSKKHAVFHIAVHSMTDRLHGQTREMQIALLYDPRRKSEKAFANLWITELRKEFPDYKFARNNPYKGDGEGLASYFRKRFKEKNYVGLELEMNQGLLRSFKTAQERKAFSQSLAASLKRAVDLFS